MEKNMKKNICMYIYLYIHITESLWYTPETNTALQINYAAIKKERNGAIS